MHGCVGSWGRIDTMLAVVRKPPESIQMPLSLFLRMSIITSAVMPPAKEDKVRGPQGRRGTPGLRPSPPEAVEGGGGWYHCGPPGPYPIHSLTLLLLQQLPPSLEAGLGSLHAHRLLDQGEDLSEVKSALAAPPALSLGMGPELRVFGGDVRADAQLVRDVAGPLCGGDGGLLTYH